MYINLKDTIGNGICSGKGIWAKVKQRNYRKNWTELLMQKTRFWLWYVLNGGCMN